MGPYSGSPRPGRHVEHDRSAAAGSGDGPGYPASMCPLTHMVSAIQLELSRTRPGRARDVAHGAGQRVRDVDVMPVLHLQRGRGARPRAATATPLPQRGQLPVVTVSVHVAGAWAMLAVRRVVVIFCI